MQEKTPRLPRWLPIALVIFGILVISAIVILLLSSKDQLTQEEKEIDAKTYDITDLDETLTDSFAAAAEKNPNKDYQTEISETKFSDLTAKEFCSTQKFSCSNILKQKLTKIPATNSNALNYYLDHNFAVIITFGSTTTVIYGALYDIPNYLTFNPTQTDFDDYGYKSKVEIFNHLTGSETFYIIKLSAN